jgi:HEAT repeat protein
MHTPRGFPLVFCAILVGWAMLAGPALGQVPGPATAPATPPRGGPPPATRPDDAADPALRQLLEDAHWVLKDVRSSDEDKVKTCDLLRRVGPKAREAAPWLAAALKDRPPVRAAAVEALRAIGPDAIPELLEACDARNPEGPRLAAVALVRSMPQSKDAVPKLIEQLRSDAGSSRRVLAIDGLAAIGPAGGQRALDALAEALGDRVPTVAAAAVRALPAIDPTLDATALTQCEVLLSGGNVEGQVAAARWLGMLDQQRTPSLRRLAGTSLASAMKDRARPVRLAAAAALTQLRPPAEAVIPTLTDILKNPPKPDGRHVDNRAVADALGVLASMGPDAAAASGELVTLLYSDEQQAVENATAAMIAIGPKAAPALIATLGRRGDDFVARSRAAAVLADLYPCGEPTIAALVEALKDPDEAVRLAAATALGSCAPPPASARPGLAAALRDPTPEVRRAALRAWTILDPTGQAGQAPDVPVLVGVLKGDDNPARADAASVLGAIGPWAAGQALPTLTRMADNHEPCLRRVAALALVKLRPDGRGLEPALIAAVRNADAEERAILAAVVRRSPEHTEATRRLQTIASEDPDPAVRAEAARAAKDLE